MVGIGNFLFLCPVRAHHDDVELRSTGSGPKDGASADRIGDHEIDPNDS